MPFIHQFFIFFISSFFISPYFPVLFFTPLSKPSPLYPPLFYILELPNTLAHLLGVGRYGEPTHQRDLVHYRWKMIFRGGGLNQQV